MRAESVMVTASTIRLRSRPRSQPASRAHNGTLLHQRAAAREFGHDAAEDEIDSQPSRRQKLMRVRAAHDEHNFVEQTDQYAGCKLHAGESDGCRMAAPVPD